MLEGMAVQERNIDNVPDLTAQEREALLSVMQRAKDFDRENSRKAVPMVLEGQLYKWTNAFKGWQPRWFSVDHDQGVLHYYTSEERKKLPPRASLHLWGAQVSPSEEDSQTFNLHGANNEIYRLRAADAKERQHWVAQLRQEVEHANSLAMGTKDYTASSSSSPSLLVTNTNSHSSKVPVDSASNSPKSAGTTPIRKIRLHQSHGHRALSIKSWRKKGKEDGEEHGATAHDDMRSLPVGGDQMLESFFHLQDLQQQLSAKLETEIVDAGLEVHNQDVLLLQATSQAAVKSVQECMMAMNRSLSLTSGGSSPSHFVLPNLPPVQNNRSHAHGVRDQEDKDNSLHRSMSLGEASSRTKAATSKRVQPSLEVP